MRVNFVGDVGLFSIYEDRRIDPFKLIRLPEADLNIANFEFVVSRTRDKFFYDVQNHYSCSFSYLDHLFLEKFDGYGLANNHVMDYGPTGAGELIDYLKLRGIMVFGFSTEETYTYASFDIGGIRLGVIAFVKPGRWSREINGTGPDSYDPGRVCGWIRELKKTHDHVVIYPHWGTELVEIPEEKDIVNAREFIDAGATAVVGHHPHISQGIESYRQGVIAYSLGSFIYVPEQELGYSDRDRNRNISICLQLKLDKDSMRSYQAHYYRYNPMTLLPEELPEEEIRPYATFLAANIENRKLYSEQVRKKLFRRELQSFWKRFRSNPFQTGLSYMKYLNPSKLKKLLH